MVNTLYMRQKAHILSNFNLKKKKRISLIDTWLKKQQKNNNKKRTWKQTARCVPKHSLALWHMRSFLALTSPGFWFSFDVCMATISASCFDWSWFLFCDLPRWPRHAPHPWIIYNARDHKAWTLTRSVWHQVSGNTGNGVIITGSFA